MTHFCFVLLTLLFSLSGPAVGADSDFGRSSHAARGPVIIGENMARVDAYAIRVAAEREKRRGIVTSFQSLPVLKEMSR